MHPGGLAFCSLLVNAEENQGRKSLLCVDECHLPQDAVALHVPSCLRRAPGSCSHWQPGAAHRSTPSEHGNGWGTRTSAGKGDAFQRDLLWSVPH